MTTMTKCAVITLMAAVSLTSDARANDGPKKQCSLATLRGSYIFTATGFNIVNGVPVPKTIAELIDFEGDGLLSVPGGTLSVNGMITQIQPGGVGTYTLEQDCTGTVAFNGGPSFRLFITNAKSGTMVQTNPNTVFQGHVTFLRELPRHPNDGQED